jgi:outer membrane biosynthesis protein TonB
MTNYNNPQDDRVSDNSLPLTPAEQIERDRLDRAAARDGQVQFEREIAAENSGAASGIAIGGTIAALIALGAGAIYYFGQPKPAPTTTIINTPASPAASTAPKPEQPTKTIERTTIDRTAPAPTPQVIEVPKPILVPGATKTIEVPKPILVPGATKTIEVPKPSVTTSPSTPRSSSQPTASPSPVPFSSPSPFTSPAGTSPRNDSTGGTGAPATTPAPGASPSSDSSGSVSPATPSSGNN